MFKKIIVLTAMLVAALTISASAAEFTDVPETHWAHDSINFVSERGIMNGTGDGRFSPDASVTVEQFATMLVRQFGNGNLTSTGSTWYAPYMEAAEADGYLTNVTTNVGESLNRFNMAHMIYNVLPVLPYDAVNDSFNTGWTDITSKIADWGTSIPYYTNAFGILYETYPTDLQRSVYACYKLGLLTGVDAVGTFAGEGTMTRSQAAVVMERIINYVDSFSPAAHPIPAGAQRVTQISCAGLQGSSAVGETFNVVGGSTASTAAFSFDNPSKFSKLTFTVTPTKCDSDITITCAGTWYADHVVRMGETITVTLNTLGDTDLTVHVGGAYSNYTISNMYLHD